MPHTPSSTERPLLAEDAVRGSLAQAIWRLAWPITLSQAVFMVPGLYDSYWLGRLGASAQAAAGLAMSVRVTLISVLMALSGASGAVVARYVGANDRRNANLATLQAVILMTVSSAVLGVFGYLLAEPLLRLAGADAEVLPLAVPYARIVFAGLIGMELLPSIGGMVNTAGAPQVRLTATLWMMAAQALTQPFLSRRFGIVGAAVAVAGANAVVAAWEVAVLLRGRATVRIDVRDLRLDLPMMGRIVRIALPAVVQRGAPNLATSLLFRLISGHGAETLAAWVVGSRVLAVIQVPGVGISGAAAAMMGLNLGARQIGRARDAVRWTGRAAAAVSVGLMVILWVAAPRVLAWFNLEPAALPAGIAILRWLSFGNLLQTVTLVYDAAQVGAGDTLSPMLANLAALWLVQLPLAWLLGRAMGPGPQGLWLGLVVGWAVQATLMVGRYRAGRWRTIW